MDYDKLRSDMVKHQIEERGIVDQKLLNVMREIPRELFVPESMKANAYEDNPLPIGQGQTISQPYIVALMTELLALRGNEKVLEIGAGSGYQAAILSKLAKKIITVERVKELAQRTKRLLRKHNYKNITVLHGDGTKGYAKEAPYEAIMITAAAEKIPQKIIEQLADNGRIIAPVGSRWHQELIRLRKRNGKLEEDYHGGVIFVPLIGDD